MEEMSTPTVAELMKKPVHTLSRDEKLKEAAVIMSRENVGSVVVVDGEKPVGIVTEKDFILALDQDSGRLEKPIQDSMSSPLTTIRIDDHPTIGITLMAKKNITHLAVTDKKEQVVGMISQKDLVIWFMEHPAVLLGL
ncbi:MAG: CBS domain-containing protein [Nitrososphaerales archaeon]